MNTPVRIAANLVSYFWLAWVAFAMGVMLLKDKAAPLHKPTGIAAVSIGLLLTYYFVLRPLRRRGWW